MPALPQDLTIVIPIYNDASWLSAAIDSCLEEAGTILLYDNASTDGSGEICAKYAQHHAHVRHIRHEKNIGAFANMTAALEACETPFISMVGAHDKLTPGYAAPLLAALRADPDLSLVTGTIQHIDENDAPLPLRTESHWINHTRALPPLARVDAFVRKLRDCFIFYGIWRTKALRAAWYRESCLGFDRIVLTRAAAQGKIAFSPQSTFLARDFPKTRNSKQDRERRVEMLALTPSQKNNFTRNHQIALTVLSLARTDDDLTQAFATLRAIDRRLHNRRRYQRWRLALAGLGGLIGAGIVWCLLHTH